MGALGALARYGLGSWVQRALGNAFPWGTLVVNLCGCFLFGIVWALAEERSLISAQTKIILLVGFMGAFTTFSSYAFETVQLIQDSKWMVALFNFSLQNILGFFILFLGIRLGRLL